MNDADTIRELKELLGASHETKVTIGCEVLEAIGWNKSDADRHRWETSDDAVMAVRRFRLFQVMLIALHGGLGEFTVLLPGRRAQDALQAIELEAVQTFGGILIRVPQGSRAPYRA